MFVLWLGTCESKLHGDEKLGTCRHCIGAFIIISVYFISGLKGYSIEIKSFEGTKAFFRMEILFK